MIERRTLPQFPNYEIASDGNVYRVGRETPMKPIAKKNGYFQIFLCENGKYHRRHVHRLVCEAFHGPCPPEHECRHNNGTRSDNRSDNLCWGTRSDNRGDSRRHGTMPLGELHANSILTTLDVLSIRRLHRDGNSQTRIALIMKRKVGTIGSVLRGRTWAHVQSDADLLPTPKRGTR